ncbi:hypothetical protein Q5752_002182 [Cryptotrichosporon argae]
MDVYTTSFTYPQPGRGALRASASPHAATLPLSTTSGSLVSIPTPHGSAPQRSRTSVGSASSRLSAEKQWECVQTLCNEVTSREGCLVTASREPAVPGASPVEDDASAGATAGESDVVFNYHLSGAYAAVMAARGAILREVAAGARTVLKVARADVLDSPLAAASALKPDVGTNLEAIAAETLATLQVANPDAVGVRMPAIVLATARPLGSQDNASDDEDRAIAVGLKKGAEESVASYGLETERMCDVIITGSTESVELAKVRMLVLLDQINGLSAECVDIDYKLHPVITGRRRRQIQQIQEETATNIYFPTILVGVLNPPMPEPQQRSVTYPPPISAQMTGMSYAGGSPGPAQHMGSAPHTHGMHNGMGNGNGILNMQMTSGMLPPPPHQARAISPSPGSGFGPAPGLRGPLNNGHSQFGMPPQHGQHPYGPQQAGPQRHNPYGGPGAQWALPGAPLHPEHTGMSQMSQMTSITNGGPHNPGPGFRGPPGPSPMMHAGPMHMGAIMSPSPTGMGYPPGFGVPGPAHGHAYGHGLGHGGPQHMRAHPMRGHPMNGFSPDIVAHPHGHFAPPPMPDLNTAEHGILGKANTIWITGEHFNVSRARDMLLHLAGQKGRLLITRTVAVLPRKLDWLLTERLDEVRTILYDNGTYMQAPPVGSSKSLIKVFGDHRVNLERTIRAIMALVCQFYVSSLWLLPLSFDVLMPQTTVNLSQMQPILKHISHASGGEVVFKSNCFEVHGLEYQVRKAILMISELEACKNFTHQVRFHVELSTEHREFISGKKNGKINKIMKSTGADIKFDMCNDFNFLMDVTGACGPALAGLSMLQEELPAEISFHIPESYHKRIIGVGGKSIQAIMKDFGVYVKFCNAEEYGETGGYHDNEDNVVARTPAKNAMNLELLKQAVMEMVAAKDKDFTTETVAIPRRYHRTLLGDKNIFIHDIENKTSSHVRFPSKESASDMVAIFGPESQVHIAAAMLLDHVPFEADLHVPPSPELTRLVTSAEFVIFADGVKRDHQITIQPSARFGQGDEAIFKFRCQRSNVDFLTTARDALEEFLAQHNVQVYPSNAQKRVDSYTDAFSHFNSKLLGNAGPADEAAQTATADRRHRASSSQSNVKALFNGPSPAPAFDAAIQFNGLGYHDPRFYPNDTVIGMGVDVSKRGSDPLLGDKLRAAATFAPGGLHVHAHPHPPHATHAARAVSGARTQSLDITSLNFVRALSGPGAGPGAAPASGFTPLPAAQASPTSAGGQFFAHAPGAVGHKYVPGHASSQSVAVPSVSVPPSVDSVAHVLGNTHLSH